MLQGPEIVPARPWVQNLLHRLGVLGQQLVSQQAGHTQAWGLLHCLETLSHLEGDSVVLPTGDQPAAAKYAGHVVHCPVM